MDSLEDLGGADNEEMAEAKFNTAFEVLGECVANYDRSFRTCSKRLSRKRVSSECSDPIAEATFPENRSHNRRSCTCVTLDLIIKCVCQLLVQAVQYSC